MPTSTMPTATVARKPHHLIRFDLCCIVFVGGALGTVLRYALSTLPAAGAFQIGTFVANMLAAFCYATLSAYLPAASWIRPQLKEPLNRGLGMGLCGGLSTMSTLALEEFIALRDGAAAGMVAYCSTTFICGLLLAWFGAALGSALAREHTAKAADNGNADNSGDVDKEASR